MINSYLLEVIKALEPAERKEFALLLESPNFNKGANAKELKHLYQIIFDAAPKFPDTLLNKEFVYFQVFSDATVVPGKLEKLMAELNKMIRLYALTQNYLLESNERQQQIDWAAWLRNRGVLGRSRQVTTKLKEQNEYGKIASLAQFKSNFLIAEEQHEWESIYNQAKGDLKIPQLICTLDLFFHTYRTELLNRYLLQKKATKLPEIEYLENESTEYLDNSILLNITKHIHRILHSDIPAKDEIQDLVQLLQVNEAKLSAQSLVQFYSYLRNACNLMINGGHLEFYPILHEINKDNLSRGYFFVNGGITPHVYLSLIQTATRAKDNVWALAFIKLYKRKIIGGDEHQFFYRINMTQYYFAEGKFEEALSIIPDAPSTDYYHQMVRRLELKIYYELDSDLLIFKLDALRKFIERTARKTLAPNVRELNLNFLNILLQISQSSSKDKTRSARLVQRIEQKKLLADRAWLLEKAEELA